MFAVDNKIAGLNPTNSIPIFNDDCYTTTNFVRNTNCWAYSYDLTCISPWNSSSNPDWDEQHMAGTLITPQHIIFAKHFQPNNGDVFRFIDRQNNEFLRTLVRKTNVTGDIAIGLLDGALPTNSFCFAKVLPSDYDAYINTGYKLPALYLDQEEKALVADLRWVSQDGGTKLNVPVNETRSTFNEPLYDGDSGNPAFIIINDELVLLTVWTTSSYYGTSVTEFKDEINQSILSLDTAQGITNMYQLTEIDLTEFSKLHP